MITRKSISTLYTLFDAMGDTDFGDNAANGMVTLAPMVMDASLLTATFLANHIWALAEATALILLSQVASTPAFRRPEPRWSPSGPIQTQNLQKGSSWIIKASLVLQLHMGSTQCKSHLPHGNQCACRKGLCSPTLICYLSNSSVHFWAR